MKSKEEIRNEIVNILYGCNGNSAGANLIVDYVYDAMEEYASQQAPASTPPVSAMEDGWVKAETPPETNERVLCLCDTGLRRVGYFYKNEWEQDGPYSSFKQDGYTVTHWHPLPPPPSK